jgi:hypothetical protein
MRVVEREWMGDMYVNNGGVKGHGAGFYFLLFWQFSSW